VNVLVDTAVWSLAFRRKPKDLNERERLVVEELAELITDGRAQIIGMVRQEALSGIKTHTQFETLRKILAAFPDEPVSTADHEAAAEASSHCQSKGIAFSAVDMLICAVAQRREMSIFTTDPDFEKYARVLPLRLHSVPA